MSMKPYSKPALHLFLIALLGLLAYSNSFHVPFFLDDDGSILNNMVIKDLSRFLSGDGYAYNPRRFLGYLSVALNYRFGGLDVTGYHVFNLAVHIITAWLVYALAAVTLRTPFFAEAAPKLDEAAAPPTTMVPLFAALIFVAHPVQTQAVTYIIQRLAALATLFYVLSLVCYAKARLVQEAKGKALGLKPVSLYLLALAFAGCAMKTKEIAFTLPFVIALYEFLFFRMSTAKKLAVLAPMVLTAVVVPLGVLGSGRSMGSLLSEVNALTRVDTNVSRLDYLFTQFPVIATYLRLFFLPVNQNLDYDFPVYHSFVSLPVLLPFLLLLALFLLSLFLLRRSWDPRVRLISFGILWFFITISVESSIIPIADVIYEHRVYLPSVGAFIAFAAAASLLLRRVPALASMAAATVVVLALAGTTFARNQVWGSEVSLWSDAVRKAPNKARPHYNLALALDKVNRSDEALPHAVEAARFAPSEPYAYNLIGSIMAKTGRIEQAAAALTEAVRLAPQVPAPHVNLGDIYAKAGQTAQALEQYQIALQLMPTDADIYHKIGVVHAVSNDMDKAVIFFQCAASIAPQRPDYRVDLEKARNLLGSRVAPQMH
ncbi:tetratricopeptide repeat protein [Geomonas edaphica]|uniref:tetratricopeptide repeat protein n=1 Tax=Geomonas edaphica TaxID=2570226 RepID=UPI0010A770E2|nr:tetratricopeptide repeat protein [Geomonas edaphica]